MYRFPVLLLGFGLAACANAQSRRSVGLRQYDLAAAPSSRIELPGVLAEVSGIAYTKDGRLLAQGDESAVIYQVDFPSGRVVKRFAIGDAGGPLLGDFVRRDLAGRVPQVADALVTTDDWRTYAVYFAAMNCPRLDCDAVFAYAPDADVLGRLREAFPGRTWYEVRTHDNRLITVRGASGP